MDDLSVRDIQQLFHGCLISYKGTPSFVHRVMENRNIVVEQLGADKVETVKFALDDFKSLNARLGFVNTAVGCAYVKRRPVRRYQVGISTENMAVDYMGTEYDAAIKNEIATLKSGAITHTINGDYPELAEAYETSVSLHSSFAFDRQFCVRYDGAVFYRGRKLVGFLEIDPDQPLDISCIRFDDEYTHLITLLDGSYGKSI